MLSKSNKTHDERRSSVVISDGRRQGEGANPYLNARRTWNSHVGSIVQQNKMLMILALAGLMIVLASVGGLIHVGTQSKYIPYVYEVDKLGQTRSVGAITAASPLDSRIMSATVADFISDVRLVTADITLQRRAILRAYSKIANNDSAMVKMREWYKATPEKDPFRRAETELVATEIKSILQQSPETWQIDWVETTRERNGALKGEPAAWRALVTVYQAQTSEKTTEEQMRDNPANIFVRDFSWSRVQ